MVNVKKSREIKGDPDLIWSLINQVSRYPEWLPGVVEAKITSKSKKQGLGRQQVLKTDMSMGKGETLQEVIVWEPPNRITWQHLKDIIDGQEFKHAREIKTTLSITNHNGKVTFRMVGSWVPVGISGKLLTRTMRKTVSKNFEQALQNLEKLIKQESKKSIS